MNDRLSKLRKDQKLNQEDFANRIGLTKNFISLVETGNRTLSDRSIKDICREFGVNEEWLRTGTGEMYKSLSREEEIAQITATLFKEEDSTFKYRLIKALCGMDEKGWDYLEKLLDEITKKD